MTTLIISISSLAVAIILGIAIARINKKIKCMGGGNSLSLYNSYRKAQASLQTQVTELENKVEYLQEQLNESRD